MDTGVNTKPASMAQIKSQYASTFLKRISDMKFLLPDLPKEEIEGTLNKLADDIEDTFRKDFGA